MAALGLCLGLPFARGAAAAASFDMNTLFTASQYGDFARVESGVPASSGGLLTRWEGLRADGNANMRFDFMPYTNAPAVGAYGPNGENCIRFTGTADEYFVSSADRGGAANLVIPAGPGADTADGNGFVAIARYKMAASGSPQFYINNYYGWTPFAYQSLQDITGPIYFKPQGASNALQSNTTVGAWVTVGMRRNKDGTASLYVDDGTTAVSTTTGLANASMEQWFAASRSGTAVTDVAGYLYGHVELTDEQFANAFNWVAGN